MFKIDKKITGYKVLNNEQKAELAEAKQPVVVLSTLLTRPEQLDGSTIAFKPTGMEDTFYITINYTTQNGLKVPFELFINTKNVDKFEELFLLSRLVTAIFRKGGDVSFIFDSFAAVHCPKGGYFSKADKTTGKRKYFNSIYNEMGLLIQNYLASLNNSNPVSFDGLPLFEESELDKVTNVIASLSTEDKEGLSKLICPECSEKEAVMMDNCLTCLSCGYSKCS